MTQPKEPKMHRYIIPGLDALIGDPDILEPTAITKQKAELMIIPAHYIDRCRQFRDELSNRGEAAQKLLHSFAKILENIHLNDGEEYSCPNGMRIVFQKDLETSAKSTAEITVAAARCFIENSKQPNAEDTAILTGDNTLVAFASLEDIDVAHINPEVYTGRRKIKMTEEIAGTWSKTSFITEEQFKKCYPDESELSPNEFVEFVPYDSDIIEKYDFLKFIGRFQKINDEWVIQAIHYIYDLPKFLQLRTPGQAMFAEALMAPASELPIVICPSTFGVGKTYLAIAIGVQLTIFTKNPHYDAIFVCPRDSELGKDIGFLPGDETKKTIAKAMPILDNFETFLRLRGDKEKGGAPKGRMQIKKDIDKYLEEYFEFVSAIHMGGRSLSNMWIILDEAQEFERFQMNQFMKREADGSKMIIMGDPQQIYNRHLSKNSNGLSYAANKMRGSEYAAIITMHEGEITRSKASKEIAKFLG